MSRTHAETRLIRDRLCAYPTCKKSVEDGFVAVCVDRRRDRWALFPVSALDKFGAVAEIHDQASGPRPLTAAERKAVIFHFSVDGRCSLDAVYDLCWRDHQGLQSLRTVCAAVLGLPETSVRPS